MPSFSSFLQVSGREYEITHSDFNLFQHLDRLGRPASLVLGGIYTIEINSPGESDPTLYDWMINPEKQLTGQVVMKHLSANITLKVIRFVSAYCVDLYERFDGTTSTASFKLTIRISPEKVIIDGIVHDNRWPNPTEGVGMTGEEYIVQGRLAKYLDSYQARAQPPAPPKPPLAPPKLPICSDIQAATQGKTKQERYDARMAVIEAGRNNPSVDKKKVDEFEKNNKAIERAKLADDIYLWDKDKLWADQPGKYQDKINKLTTTHPPEGWEVLEPFVKDPDTGFAYAVYQSKFEKPPVPVLVFRGTDNDDAAMVDWKANAVQGMGMENAQFTQSMQLAKELKIKYEGKLEIAGHSKAGGQAAAASTVTGTKGYTFNAAGVHESTLAKYSKTRGDADRTVQAYNFPYDVLSTVQDQSSGEKALEAAALTAAGGMAVGHGALGLLLAPLVGLKTYFNDDMPPAAGVRTTVPAQDINGNPIEEPGLMDPLKRVDYHGMPYLINSMEKQKQDDLKAIGEALGCN